MIWNCHDASKIKYRVLNDHRSETLQNRKVKFPCNIMHEISKLLRWTQVCCKISWSNGLTGATLRKINSRERAISQMRDVLELSWFKWRSHPSSIILVSPRFLFLEDFSSANFLSFNVFIHRHLLKSSGLALFNYFSRRWRNEAFTEKLLRNHIDEVNKKLFCDVVENTRRS